MRLYLLAVGIFVVAAVVLLSPYGRHQRTNRILKVERHYRAPLPDASTLLSELVLVFFDTETTGVNPNYDRILELGAAKYIGGELVDERSWMIDPQQLIPEGAQAVHGITPDDVRGARTFEEIYPEFAEFSAGAALVAHNGNFDVQFMGAEIERAGYPLPPHVTIDTLQFFRRMLPGLPRYRLETVAGELNIEGGEFHRALDDAIYTGIIFYRLVEDFGPATTLADVYARAGNLVYFKEPAEPEEN